ncbi:MAG: hypothetical protein QM820_19835 [Minicystis sp.]
MTTHHASRLLGRAAAVLFVSAAAYACGSSGEPAGMPCTQASECYPGVDQTTIKGDVLCLDKVSGGYCTHQCTTDADCCAVSGECPGGHPEVCAPFESTGMMMCFLSCEASDLGGVEEGAYCQQYAGAAFGCRSTGGGANNRKICSP